MCESNFGGNWPKVGLLLRFFFFFFFKDNQRLDCTARNFAKFSLQNTYNKLRYWLDLCECRSLGQASHFFLLISKKKNRIMVYTDLQVLGCFKHDLTFVC